MPLAAPSSSGAQALRGYGWAGESPRTRSFWTSQDFVVSAPAPPLAKELALLEFVPQFLMLNILLHTPVGVGHHQVSFWALSTYPAKSGK